MFTHTGASKVFYLEPSIIVVMVTVHLIGWIQL